MDETSARTRDQFHRQAAHYATSRTHAEGDTLKVVARWVEPLKPGLAVDVASGTGFTAFTIAPYSGRVISYDLTEAMLHQGRTLANQRGLTNVEFLVGLAES